MKSLGFRTFNNSDQAQSVENSVGNEHADYVHGKPTRLKAVVLQHFVTSCQTLESTI